MTLKTTLICNNKVYRTLLHLLKSFEVRYATEYHINKLINHKRKAVCKLWFFPPVSLSEKTIKRLSSFETNVVLYLTTTRNKISQKVA